MVTEWVEPSVDLLPDRLKEFVRVEDNTILADDVPASVVIKARTTTDNSYLTKRMGELSKKQPDFLEKVSQRATIGDFRSFVKDMLEGQKNLIASSLRELHDQGFNKEYQSALLGWAKFAYGTESKTDINVEIKEKRTLISAITEEYKFSEAVNINPEDIEMADEKETDTKKLLMSVKLLGTDPKPKKKKKEVPISSRVQSFIENEYQEPDASICDNTQENYDQEGV